MNIATSITPLVVFATWVSVIAGLWLTVRHDHTDQGLSMTLAVNESQE